MLQKRHNGFKYQQFIVLVFILLNGLFTAAPFVHASVVNRASIQNQRYEMDGNFLSGQGEEQEECHFVIRNKHKVFCQAPHTERRPEMMVMDNHRNLPHQSNPGLLIRHPFYSFLSIYYLF
jgi:hypothetical protein